MQLYLNIAHYKLRFKWILIKRCELIKKTKIVISVFPNQPTFTLFLFQSIKHNVAMSKHRSNNVTTTA